MTDANLIRDFLDDLLVEQGLSANTLEAYRLDLEGLSAFLSLDTENTRDTSLLTTTQEQLKKFLDHLFYQQLAPATVARKLSSIRRFYRYLILTERLAKDPSRLLESPKPGETYLKSLTNQKSAHCWPPRNGAQNGGRVMPPCWNCCMPRD